MAYDNNINPGNPPLVWSRIKQAFDRVNENFTIIGGSLARAREKNIVYIETSTPESNPVRIVTSEAHGFNDGQPVFVFGTGISQLDNNEYYVRIDSLTEVLLYSDAALTITVNGTAFDAYTSGATVGDGGKIQAFSEFASIDFENLTTNVSPNSTSTFNLGSQSKPWKALYVGEYNTNDAALLNGVWLGSAQIKGTGGTIDLPLNSTVNGQLIINPDNTFFKSVQIDNGDRIVADEFVATLNFLSGNGISMNADSGAESITFTNTGVLSNIAGAGISVTSATGNVTIANTGVRSLTNTTALPVGRTEGAGINISGSTGDAVKITNTGVLEIQPGSAAITVFTDPATGIVTITNAAPAGNTVRFVNVDGSIIEANSVAGTLNLVSGYGMSLAADTLSDTVTFNFDGNGVDIVGSVFADDSTKMVDAVSNEMYASGGFFGDLTGNVAGNITGNLTGNSAGVHTGDVVGDTTGYHTGDVTGSVFADDSTKLIDAVEGKIVGDVETASLRTSETKIALGENAGLNSQGIEAIAIGLGAGSDTQGDNAVAIGEAAGNNAQGIEAVAIGRGAGANTQGNRAVAISIGAGSTGQGVDAIAIGYNAGQTGQGTAAVAIGALAGETSQGNNSIIINATNSALDQTTANTFTVKPIRNAIGDYFLQYDPGTGEITYNNTLTTISADIIGSVFADDSTILVNASDGSFSYIPTDPADWNGTAPTTVGEAIDRLATLVKALNAGTGA